MNPDEETIRDIIRRCQDAWNSRNGAAYGAQFDEAADFVVVDGRHVRGRPAISAGHQYIFDTVYKGSINNITVEDVRFVRPDVALAHARAHLELHVDPGAPPRGANARSTWVLTKERGGWTVAAFQNTPIAQESQR